MLDIRFVREHPEEVRENIRKKFQEQKLPLVDEVLALDAELRAVKTEADSLRARRNSLSKQIGVLMGQAKKDPAKAQEAEAVKAQVAEQAARLAELEGKEPGLEEPSVPIGPDDSHNVEVQRFGEPLVPDFPVPYHTEIMESLDGIDLDAARRVAGNGFYYLKGDIARLHSAVLSYARDFMIDKGFTYYIPPFMIRSNVVTGVMSFSEMDAMMYKIEGEDLYLIGTSEHSMIGAFIDQILEEKDLPCTRTSYSPCFRKEKGARPRHRGTGRLPHPPVREAGDDRGLQARGEHGLVRAHVAVQRGALPEHGDPRAAAGMLLRRSGGPEGEILRYRSLEPPAAEIL